VVCDVGEADQITAAVDKVVAKYGRIDIPVNNAFYGSAVLSYVPRDLIRQYCDSGQLQEVLADWAPTFQGYHLYYPSRRHP
ncbi:hypothetical protein ACC706_37960, partial [Rhizobium johnstonii]